MLSLVWDESSFVAGDGQSWGRLVPGGTRMIDVEKAHPSAPLAPHATVTERVVPETKVDINGFGFEYDLRTELNGGRLYVTLQFPAGKKTWIGAISESDIKPLGWWCFVAKSTGEKFCERSVAACQAQKKGIDGARAKNDSCYEQETAQCFITRFNGDRISFCLQDKDNCNRFRQKSIKYQMNEPETGCEERR
jgi:hypothetical protein